MSSRLVPSHLRFPLALGLPFLALCACSGAGEEDDAAAAVPVFQDMPPAGGTLGGLAPNGGATAAPNGGASAPGQVPANGGEEQTAGVPLSNSGGGAAGSSASEGNAAPAAPAAGAGGSAMVGAGGAGMVQPGNPEPPPPADPFPAPPGPGCGAASFFCEGFEDFAVGAAQQNAAWRPEGNVSIDEQAIEGARALRLQPGGGQFARIALNEFSAPDNSLFGRMFLRIEALPTSPNFAHWVVVEATGSGSSERVRPLGGQFIDLQDRGIRSNFWGVGADGGPTGDWTHWDNGGLVEAVSATWQCIEWRMNGADGAIDVWIDEEFQPSMSVSRDDNPRGVPFVFPSFNNMTIGWGVFQGGTTPGQFDVHIDDIVLSRERAGCN